MSEGGQVDMKNDRDWWKGAVVYQIYPRSFCDTDGDGVGDLAGITSRVDHLVDLGVDAVWLSPVFVSPMADFGYDVSDYRNIDPTFGTLDDFDTLVATLHAAGIRLLLDWVPNHTSAQHPWFQQSRTSRSNDRRDWYIWRDGGGPDVRPNNWSSAFGGPAWSWDDATEQWYLHLFLAEQPDLNWANPDVRHAMCDVLRFWMDRGVDGFRADVVHCIGKDPGLSNCSRIYEGKSLIDHWYQPEAFPYIEEIRATLDERDGVVVGEVILHSAEQLAEYTSTRRLHMVFNFLLLFAPWDAKAWHRVLAASLHAFARADACSTWAFSNHDQERIMSRYGASDARARVAATVLLMLEGTVFLYAGDEFGLQDADVPDERIVDVDGRDGCRAPIPWDTTPTHGWATSDPWLPWPPNPDEINAEVVSGDAQSIYWAYRSLVALRKESTAIKHGVTRLHPLNGDVMMFEREVDDERIYVVANFGKAAADVALPGEAECIFDSAFPTGGFDESGSDTVVEAETARVYQAIPLGDGTG